MRWGWDAEHYERRQRCKKRRWRWQTETWERWPTLCQSAWDGNEQVSGKEEGHGEEEVLKWFSRLDKRLSFCYTTQICISSTWLSSTLLSLRLITLAYHHTTAEIHMLHDNNVHWHARCMISTQRRNVRWCNAFTCSRENNCCGHDYIYILWQVLKMNFLFCQRQRGGGGKWKVRQCSVWCRIRSADSHWVALASMCHAR